MTTSSQYLDFVASKRVRTETSGKIVCPDAIHPLLFPFQRDMTLWALRKGRAAIFADTGLGKTFMQLEWAHLIADCSLIIAPLSVARQTAREAKKLGLDVRYVRHQSEVSEDGIYITNYEMIEQMDAGAFGAVVLDESSILKALDGKTRRKLTDMFSDTPYRLCCTATPAPNDQSEIGNHAEFLGILSMADMLATFFVHDEQEWRLKGHAHTAFYQWLSSWGMSIRKPSDLDYDDDGYKLPPLHIKPTFVDVPYSPNDQLMFTGLKGIQDRTKVRRSTIAARLKVTAQLVNDSKQQWIVWCGLNDESTQATALIEGAVNVQGSDTPERKSEVIEAFQDGKVRVLVTKAKVAGFGMNFQNAHNMVFLGMNDSWESYYQCIRRCYRFGQKKPVNAYIVISEAEREIYDNVISKERTANTMSEELIKNVQAFEHDELTGHAEAKFDLTEETITGENFIAMRGDSAQRLAEVGDSTIDLSVYSPPFADLFTYSATAFDLGNSKGWDEFFVHYGFIIREVLRVTRPGRLTAVHTADVPAMLSRNGYIGIRDFPGAVVRAYEENGWIFHGRVTIDKDPQAQAIRTKSKALLFVQLDKDSSWSRPAIGDYILLFRKPGENDTPITPVAHGEMTRDMWIEWARPVWYGIRESDTLQYRTGREADDEKHIAPLQLGTIERCIKLWSNPGETVLTPFGGIGSEAYQAVKFGRHAIMIELKPSYFALAVRNLQEAERSTHDTDLFDLLVECQNEEVPA